MIAGYRRALLLASVVLPVCLAAPPAAAQAAAARKIVRSQDDLPRFTYPVSGTAEALFLADDATFNAFAAQVGRNVDAVLAGYDIPDHATMRDLLTTRANIALLAGDDALAATMLDRARALEDKPDAKLLNGLRSRALIAAHRAGGPLPQAYATALTALVTPMQWAVVGTGLKEMRASAELSTRDVALGQVRQNIEPVVASAHALSNDTAARLIWLRLVATRYVPVAPQIVAVLGQEIAANDVRKPDIWAARDVTLTAADRLTPVNVAIWDTGVDFALFPGRVYTDPHPSAATDPHGIAYDMASNPDHGYMYPVTPAQLAAYPAFRDDLKGLLDLQAAVNSPQADALKKKIAAMKPDAVPGFFETLSLYGNYVHGTHVAGIVARGNPAVRLAVARITFDYKTITDPAPSAELSQRFAASFGAYVAWLKRNRMRIVNMSWGGAPSGYEQDLEKHGIGKDAADRRAIARRWYMNERNAFEAAIRTAPEILFVCAAGNEDADSSFSDFYPAGIVAPNLLTVGAVDQAGDEASFTSYGPTVRAHANGYQVESYFPGGALMKDSGTSMASPGVANLAAKLIALDPTLTPEQTIDLIVRGETASADGRRHLVNPAASVALLRARGKTVSR